MTSMLFIYIWGLDPFCTSAVRTERDNAGTGKPSANVSSSLLFPEGIPAQIWEAWVVVVIGRVFWAVARLIKNIQEPVVRTRSCVGEEESLGTKP